MLDLACVMQQGFDVLLSEVFCGSQCFLYDVLCLLALVANSLCLCVSYSKLLQCTWIYFICLKWIDIVVRHLVS